MSYQFIHMETYSRQGNDKNRSLASICNEAARYEANSPHVLTPLPPNVLFGMEPDLIPAEIERRIDDANQNFNGRGNKIKSTTHVMVASIHSHPAYIRANDRKSQEDSAEHSKPCLEDPQDMADYTRWRSASIEWALADATKRNSEVLSIVEHLDEAHPHIHILEVPLNPRIDAKLAHPGKAAKLKSLTENPEGGVPAANIAMRAALRAWQDEYQIAVGAKFGLARLGPTRQRLSRQAHTAQKVMAKTTAKNFATAAQAATTAAAIIAAADQQAADTLAKAASDRLGLLQAAEELGEAAAAKMAEAEQLAQKAADIQSQLQEKSDLLDIQIKTNKGAEKLLAGIQERALEVSARADDEIKRAESLQTGILAVLDGQIIAEKDTDEHWSVSYASEEAQEEIAAQIEPSSDRVIQFAISYYQRLAEAKAKTDEGIEAALKRAREQADDIEKTARIAADAELLTIQQLQRDLQDEQDKLGRKEKDLTHIQEKLSKKASHLDNLEQTLNAREQKLSGDLQRAGVREKETKELMIGMDALVSGKIKSVDQDQGKKQFHFTNFQEQMAIEPKFGSQRDEVWHLANRYFDAIEQRKSAVEKSERDRLKTDSDQKFEALANSMAIAVSALLSGTIVRDPNTGKLILDIAEKNQRDKLMRDLDPAKPYLMQLSKDILPKVDEFGKRVEEFKTNASNFKSLDGDLRAMIAKFPQSEGDAAFTKLRQAQTAAVRAEKAADANSPSINRPPRVR